ncbi:PAS domain S-box protein [Desulfobulbus rhabdoformis]|uniref:PAS domain S-box protein n=1 Tax=Desulfobulbus rhabdoformis TaxID=34032 RepID=UPI001962783B|nr:PAS domain S-box protein [Desulfobulbus rhabdoformis]MBM9616889.1 PAS domain S-box protein [Desulfobulbus rhabdoformis]
MTDDLSPICEPCKPRLGVPEMRRRHVKQVLLAIRKVNRLIVSSTDPESLIEQVCESLIETMGYYNAWIALVDASGTSVTATASAGFNGGFAALEKKLARGEFADCQFSALPNDSLRVITAPYTECKNCPLAPEYAGRSGFCRRLHHQGVTYGTLSVSIPAPYAFDEEEQALFSEITNDLAVGLFTIGTAAQLRESQAMLARTEQITHTGSWEWNISNNQMRWSEGLFRIFQRDSAQGAPISEELETLFVLKDSEIFRLAIDTCRTSGTPFTLKLRAFRPDGQLLYCLVHGQAKRGTDNRINGIIGSIQDITDQIQVELAKRQSHELMRYVIEHLDGAVALLDKRLRFMFVSRRFQEKFNPSEEQIIGKEHTSVAPGLAQKFGEVYQQALSGETVEGDRDPFLKQNGELEWWKWRCRPWYEANGDIGGLVLHIVNITKQIRIEEELRCNEQQLQQIFEILPIGLWITDKQGTILRCNPTGKEIWGAEPKVPYTEYGSLKTWALPSRQAIQSDENALTKTLLTGASTVNELLEIENFAGQRKTVINYTAPLYDDSGHIGGAVVVNLDTSDRKLLEDQLHQAQKMESIGRLAGGVAHDFNNMLGVILGYAQIALTQTKGEQPISKSLEKIQEAAHRSVDLTRQLLAFARKQISTPEVIDFNDIVDKIISMLRRLIGEHIDLLWLPGESLWSIEMDPSQVHQILANLCINGSDAIGDHGKITIETCNIHLDETYCAQHVDLDAGDYVMLAVSDNGCGMDEKTLTSLFEPFFTTKDKNKGTGLGLAMVYGIVKQNKGGIHVYSEPGQGTAFKIYFPRHKVDSNQIAAPKENSRPMKEKRQVSVTENEVILVVEDEAMLLDIIVPMLTMMGYVVLSATSPNEAISIAENHEGTINLLITDVILPEMNGRELASTLHRHQPGLKVLFMSGYTTNVIAHHGVLDSCFHFMQKPFSHQDLATKVNEALAGC